jgi:hypothetical protein
MARIDIKSNGTGGGGGGGNLQLASGASMDATLRAVTDTSNTASPLKLSTTAVQVNSPLRITTSDASGFYLDAEDSATNNRFSIKRDPSAQEVTLDFASNPVGSTTLVGAIRTYQDGVNLSNAMSFIEDGSVGIGTTAPVGILHIKKTAANTRLVIDGDAGFNRLISYRTAGLQRFGLYVNNTAESGSNAGSDFAIRAYNDAGTLLTTPVFIKRSTGNVGIGTTTPTTKLVVNSTATAVNSTFDALSTATIMGDQQSPLRVLRTNGQPNVYIGTSNETPDHSVFLAGIRTGAWYNTASPTYSGQFGAYQINRANQWGTQTSASDLRMAHTFTCNGNNTRSALTITPLSAESATNTDYVAVNNLLVTTAGNFGTQPTARVQIVGDGSTSATTSLLVQNSSGTAALTVKDDLTVLISGGGIFGFGDTTNYAKKSSALDGVEIAGFGGVGLGAFGGINTFVVQSGSASLGATTANASAIFDITSTTKGFLPPRMTNPQRAAITSPAIGLMVYCTDAVEGLYVYKSTGWTFVI